MSDVSIIKSPNDRREYRGLTLENGLKVVLVSDPETEKSAASMDVFVGHMSDPKDLLGLAHFLEHMLFLGTEKYPDENEYSRYISQHSGMNNAYTSQDHTNYLFDVASEYLEPALDRFCQFFISPLFTESATDREVKAVTSEHEKNIASDIWRLTQLEKSLSDPDHDFSKFGTGNLATLDEIPKSKGISVREELLKFHDTWYSSDIMALSVLGAQPLDALEKMVVDRFSQVQKKGISPPIWTKHPFHESGHGTKTFVVPVKDLRSLSIAFPIPELQAHYKASPGNFIAHLIGHEGRGSLLSELKARQWADCLEAGEKFESRGFAVFCVTVDMTEEGIHHVDEIIGLIFQYIELIRREGLQEWIFRQCSQINDTHFRFLDKSKPYNYVSSLSSRLQKYPIKEILIGPYLIDEWNPGLVNMVLDHLVPEKMRVYVVAKVFESKATQTERWYGTKYISEKIPSSLLEGWRKSEDISPRLRMPESNLFIPTNFDLTEREAPASATPCIIKETPMVRFWFKQDDEFRVPKAKLKLEFKTPYVNLDPHHVNLSNLFLLLLRDSLNEYVYSATLTGLNYSVQCTKKGITLAIHGFNEKLHVLLDKVVSNLTLFKTDPNRFPILKEQYERSLKNFRMDQPHEHSIYYNNILLSNKDWHKNDLLDCIPELSIEAVDEFASKVFSRVYIEGLAHGNLTESDALELFRILDEALSVSKPLTASQLSKLGDRELILEENSHSVYEATNEYHKSSSIESYYQMGLRSPRANILLELLAQIFDEPCYNILRTKEQLGYLVHSGIRRTPSVQGLRFVIRSERHPSFLDSRIEAFLSAMNTLLAQMTEEEFKDHKEALSIKRLEKPKSLSGMSDRYWREILRQSYVFDRDALETRELQSISKEEFLGFFTEHLSSESKSRRKLACHVISMAEDGAGRKDEEDSPSKPPYLIKDIWAYKADRPLYPQSKYANDPKSFLRNTNAS